MISQHTSKETHTTNTKDQETLITDTTSILQQSHTPLSNLFKLMTVTFGLDLFIEQMAGTLLSKQNYEETETLAGGLKQTHNIQTTSVQNISAQRSTLLSSNHHMKKSLQEEFTILQLSKEVTRSQNKVLSSPKSNQQSNKESLSLLTPPQLLLFTPSYPSEPQWQDNRRKLMLLLAKQDRKHKELTSLLPLMALLKGTPHPSSMEIGAQPGSSLTTSISGKYSIDKTTS